MASNQVIIPRNFKLLEEVRRALRWLDATVVDVIYSHCNAYIMSCHCLSLNLIHFDCYFCLLKYV